MKSAKILSIGRTALKLLRRVSPRVHPTNAKEYSKGGIDIPLQHLSAAIRDVGHRPLYVLQIVIASGGLRKSSIDPVLRDIDK